MNLRNVNPYVESAFGEWSKTHRLVANAPRENAALPLLNQSQLTGTSSFGMSGVNAHALFQGFSVDSQHCAATQNALQRQTHWALSPSLYFCDKTMPAGQNNMHRCCFYIDMTKSELEYLGDHQASHS